MAGNTIGTVFRLTTFGESHGKAIGGIIDGCPAGVIVDTDYIASEMLRRKPGQSAITTQRKEDDVPEWLSGIYEGKTTGAPLAFLIRNKNQRSADYAEMKDVYRPSHADYTYQKKYGHRDYRGGGRASARETAARVAGGAIAGLLLNERSGILVSAWVDSIGTCRLPEDFLPVQGAKDNHITRCPHPETAAKMEALIKEARNAGDSLGGVITCRVSNMPAGLGEPVFDRLEADLAKAMLSINASKGFEIGSGFAGTNMPGSEHNDLFISEGEKVVTQTNHSGGVQGGISNGADLVFRVAFKPVATIAQKQQTVNSKGESTELQARGRHDPCVVPRAVPIVEAMARLVLADHFLRQQMQGFHIKETK